MRPQDADAEAVVAALDEGIFGVTASRPRPLTRPVRLWRRLARILAFPAITFVSWLALAELTPVREVFIPSPLRVAEVGWAIRDELASGFIVSMQMVMVGLVLGIVSGVGIGLIFGISSHARDFFEFSVDLIRPVPLFALIPLFILWFGIGAVPQVALVALGVFLILSIVTIEAIRNVSPIYVRAALTNGASRIQVYKTVVFPAIVPHLISGLRLAVASAWGLDVAAEFSGSREGLGYIMILRQQFLDTAGIILIVIIFGILAVVFDLLLKALFRRMTRWSSRTAGSGIVSEMLGVTRHR